MKISGIKGIMACVFAELFATCALAEPAITSVTARQRKPWNGKVDITFTVTGDVAAGLPEWNMPGLSVSAADKENGTNYVAAANSISGDTGTDAGTHHVVWDLNAQGMVFKSDDVVFTVAYVEKPKPYCVIDLSGGTNAVSYPVTYLAEPPSGGFNVDEYKTTKLVLKLIEAGTFMMCGTYETTLTKPFYCGIFEVTQKQYELVTGSNKSRDKGDKRPVENVAWTTIRGSCNWPSSTDVDSNSFMGRLRARTGLDFDLPTEAQWEYACRAGTTSDYNNGTNYGGNYRNDPNLNLLGRYYYNRSDGKGGYTDAHTTVGSYQPNAWGLYDMHGNVREWCLNWWPCNLSNPQTDPQGSSSGLYRMTRGGCHSTSADYNTSYYRGGYDYPSGSANDPVNGFRFVRTLSN